MPLCWLPGFRLKTSRCLRIWKKMTLPSDQFRRRAQKFLGHGRMLEF